MSERINTLVNILTIIMRFSFGSKPFYLHLSDPVMKKRPASNGCQLDAKDANEHAAPSSGRPDDGIAVQSVSVVEETRSSRIIPNTGGIFTAETQACIQCKMYKVQEKFRRVSAL